MQLIPSILGSFFTLVACAIIAHISMATPLGPWIAPAIVLVAGVLLRIISRFRSQSGAFAEELTLIQTAAATGGAIATAIGFNLPMLYFLNPDIFKAWLADPWYFCLIIGGLCITAGGLGIWLGRMFNTKLLVEQKLAFPVGDLIAKTISAQSQKAQAGQLFLGFGIGTGIALMRDGIGSFKGFLPRVLYPFQAYVGKDLALGLTPLMWAMGFIAGMDIALPLLVGLVSKYLVLYPLNNHSMYLPFSFFSPFKAEQFAVAFCSGLVMVEIVFTLLKFPQTIWKTLKKCAGYNLLAAVKDWRGMIIFLQEKAGLKSANSEASHTNERTSKFLTTVYTLEPYLMLLASWCMLHYFQVSLICQLFILPFLFLFTYQISYFSGKTGLVPYGRFVTWAVLPAMFLFKLSYVQTTILSVFVVICFATATDILFDRKVAQLCDVSPHKIYKYQWLGVVVTALGIGLFFWLLFTHFSLGSAEMFAHRARSRALLLQSITFDIVPVILGFLYGLVLRRFKLNPMMVFGGILMPAESIIGLVIGALFSWVDSRNKNHVPFWSGIFAGESIFVFTTLLMKLG